MELKESLKDLLTIDCDIETKLQILSTTNSRKVQDETASEIKSLLRDYRNYLKELKDTSCHLSSKSSDIDKRDVYLKEL